MVVNELAKEDEAGLRMLLSKIERERGLDCSQYRLSYLWRRISTRLRATKVNSCFEYCVLLDKEPDEYQELIDALTINVTEFFRDKEVYEYLQEVVFPQILKKKKERSESVVKAWSAGCASGEEPYSLAFMFLELLRENLDEVNVSIYATDIDEKSLEKGKKGVYPLTKLEEIPEVYRKYVTAEEKNFMVKPKARRLVKFRYLDLFKDTFIKGTDLILCRNVLIYFDMKRQKRLCDGFYNSLKKGGFLVIGKTEKLQARDKDFKTIDLRRRVYQKPEY